MQTVQSGNVSFDPHFWINVSVALLSGLAALLSAFGGYVVKTLKQSDANQWSKIDRISEKLDKLLGEHAVSSCNTTRRKR